MTAPYKKQTTTTKNQEKMHRHRAKMKWRHREAPCDNRGGERMPSPHARSTKDPDKCQKLHEARKGSPLQAAEGGEPCQHLDLGLLDSRTVRDNERL